MEYKDVIFKVEQGVATLTLNLPENRNAISDPNTIAEVEEVCKTVNRDMSIKVLIITGAGPAFSSGGNVKDIAAKKGWFQGSPAELMEAYRNHILRVPLAVHNVEVPTIAAVNGAAIGAGCDLSLMCDMRVASEKAKFGETFLNVGLIPGDGGAYFLPRAIGMAKACELTFTCDVIDGVQALEMGLINYLVEHDELMTTTMALARKIAGKPPAALRMSKRLLYMGQHLALPALLEQSAAYQALCHHTEDHTEALNAMFEKREPNYSGK